MLNEEAKEYFRKKGREGGKKLLKMKGTSHFSKASRARWDKEKLSTVGT